MLRWDRYWFAEGGRYSIAILRVAIGLAVWLSLDIMHLTWPVHVPAYRPVGLWMVAGQHAPPVELVDALWIVARIATIAMAVGMYSRAATAVSCAATVALASLYYSGFPSWSHAHNVVVLAQLALVGGRCGDTLSVDALVRRLRGSPPRIVATGYQWSIRLVQLAVALMFASSVFHKVWRPAPTLDWVFSDNLRNQLLVRFDAYGLARTQIANWLVDDVWRYRAAALLNLVTQTLPLVGCFVMRWPVARALCGACFVIEILGLGLVMDLWNPQWLPLAVVFVDWDRLLRRVPSGAGAIARRRWPLTVFIIAFLTLDVAASFVPRLDQRMNLYPFTGFPMFATIRAREPYNQHAPYSFGGGHVELIASDHVPSELEHRLDRYYAKLLRTRDRERLHACMREILQNARRLHPGTIGLRLYYVIFDVPAYPLRASVERRPIALLGELTADGRFRSLLGTARAEGPDIVLVPGEPIDGTLAYYTDEVPIAHPLRGLHAPRPLGHNVAYVLDDGTARWLVYQSR